MPKEARFRVHGEGEVEVDLVVGDLTALKQAYDSIFVFDVTIEGIRRLHRELPFGWQPLAPTGWFLGSRRGVQIVRDWPPTADQVAALVPRSEQLVLSSVRLTSPGFWEFLGTLNPLDVLRQYLNDRHERRKDREYRETAEQRRLALENLSLENKVLSERIRLAKDLGATDRDLAPLLNALVYKPLTALDHFQDRQVIDSAEISEDHDG